MSTQRANVEDLLGEAYRLTLVAARKPQAIELIRNACKEDPVIELVLRQKRDYLFKVREARRLGEKDGCQVTATLCDLLTQALR